MQKLSNKVFIRYTQTNIHTQIDRARERERERGGGEIGCVSVKVFVSIPETMDVGFQCYFFYPHECRKKALSM
jgi:hypothetical protein